jgi:hypothetical protein
MSHYTLIKWLQGEQSICYPKDGEKTWETVAQGNIFLGFLYREITNNMTVSQKSHTINVLLIPTATLFIYVIS